jgi:transcriptional regulator of acetoin/glycerol metabolism
MNLSPENIRAALTLTEGNVSAAARTLGVSRPTLYKWMKRHGIIIQRVAA